MNNKNKRLKLNVVIGSHLFSKFIDNAQFTHVYNVLQDIFTNQLKDIQILNCIIQDISEFSTGIILKCFYCDDGSVHFLAGDNFNMNGELRIANHNCDNSQCDIALNAFKCSKLNCECAWLRDASDTAYLIRIKHYYICKNFRENKSNCQSMFCSTHCKSELVECVTCADNYCQDCINTGKFCTHCNDYYCIDHLDIRGNYEDGWYCCLCKLYDKC